jgi:hypothetical protein
MLEVTKCGFANLHWLFLIAAVLGQMMLKKIKDWGD